MKKLTKLEQETIILFNEAEPTAEVYTYNDRLINKLDKLCEAYPDVCKIIDTNQRNLNSKPKTYNLSKKLICVKNPYKITMESKEKRQINMAKAREAKRNAK